MIFDFCNPNGLAIFLAIIIFLGGLNWLVTAIRSIHYHNQDVDDLFELMTIPQWVSNVVYIIVFIVSLIVSFRMIYPAKKVVSLTNVGGM